MSVFTEQPKSFCQYDYIEDDSDQEIHGRDSSDDELDILLNGTPQQKKRLTRSLSRGSLEMSSSEDEFEKEMEKELEETMRQHEQQFALAAGSAASEQASGSTATDDKPRDDFYNDVYFDSDDDENEKCPEASESGAGSSSKSKPSPGKHRVFTNDELLYDPEIDDKNQEWVDRQRGRYYPGCSTRGSSGSQTSDQGGEEEEEEEEGKAARKEARIPKSDAVLNCPACLTTLCLDCQRHELYTHQYRAMFVLNCTVVRSERLAYAAPQKAGRKKWRKKQSKMQLARVEDTGAGGASSSASPTSQAEYFHPVRCSRCNTEVAVYDSDDVFHFFNVLTSLS